MIFFYRYLLKLLQMKIVLLGYMASGKSSIGNITSKKLFLPFIDLDKYIESEENMTINNIFEEKGEIHFRLIEHIYLKKILNSDDNFILSLGGGTPCYADNMDLILNTENTISIYLQANINTLVQRLISVKDKRPLIKELDDKMLIEYIGKHLFERCFFYEQANKKVIIDNKTINEISKEIIKSLN